MREIGRIDGFARNNGGNSAGVVSDRVPAATEVAAYAAEVRRLTNYEVWRSVESALLAMAPGQETENAQWRNLRILLEELKWRLSGLEGSGSVAGRIPMNIRPN
jgi:hypothetical protein